MRTEVLNQPCQNVAIGVIKHAGIRSIQRSIVALERIARVGSHELEQAGHHPCGIAGEIVEEHDAQLLPREKTQVPKDLLMIVTTIQIDSDKNLRFRRKKRESMLVVGDDM